MVVKLQPLYFLIVSLGMTQIQLEWHFEIPSCAHEQFVIFYFVGISTNPIIYHSSWIVNEIYYSSHLVLNFL